MSKKKNKVLIFCEKSKSIGNGHFIRSQRLLNTLKLKKYDCKLYCNKNNTELKKIIEKSKKDIKLILDLKYYKKLNLKASKKIVKIITFENLSKKKFKKGVNLYPLDIQYKKNHSGPNYFIYPSYFKSLRKITSFKKKYINILVIQGGTDANNNLNTITRLLLKERIQFNFKIILKTNNINTIDKKFFMNKQIKIIGKISNLRSIFKKTDIALSACGNLAFELGYLGIPTIHISSEPREITRAKIFRKKGLGLFYPPNKKKKIVKELNRIISNDQYRKTLIERRINYFRKSNKIIKYLN